MRKNKKEKLFLDLEGRFFFDNEKDWDKAIKLLCGRKSGKIVNAGKAIEPEDNDQVDVTLL